MNDVELSAALTEQFCQRMDDYVSRHSIMNSGELKLAIAYSGGLDSTALLHLAAVYCVRKKIALSAFHVHHGLSPNADSWLDHCHQQAVLLNISFFSRKITVNETGDGLEAAARRQRYVALKDMAIESGIDTVLFAHHLDDQVETIFIRMLRGSGLDGAGGMCAEAEFPLTNANGIRIFRPLLNVRRDLLESYVAQCGCKYIFDESNNNPKFFRNALRHQVLPALESIRPGSLEAFARSGRLLNEASDLLAEYVAAEFNSCRVDGGVSRSALRNLPLAKRMQVFRCWLKSIPVRMPSEVKLSEIVRQIISVGNDQSVRIEIDDGAIHVYRDLVYFQSEKHAASEDGLAVYGFRWNSQSEISFPELRGSLVFEYSDYGIPECDLAGNLLTLRLRQGGERMRIGIGRPSRSLKHLYQDAGIPGPARVRLPLVLTKSGILFAAGIGMNADYCSEKNSESGDRVVKITWLTQ